VKYNPEAAVDTLPPGDYDAVIKLATDKVSKAGNEMIELILTCYNPKGGKVDVWDWLLSTDDFQPKVRRFCEAAGLDYSRGALEARECEGKNVRVELQIVKDPKYGAKNKVMDYLRSDGSAPEPTASDDDIPF
jgi:hypothetical protein